MSRIPLAAATATLGLALVLFGCAPSAQKQTTPPASSNPSTASAQPSGAVAAQKPVKPEVNPIGDIPDDQAFVSYTAGNVITLVVPEGWARTDGPGSVGFTDKLNAIQLAWGPSSSAPTVASVRSVDVPKLAASGPAFKLTSVKAFTLPEGPAVLARYQINSAPNAVTGKQYRLDVERYTIFNGGRRVDLTLLSPVGADNVDVWRIISGSMEWK